MIDVLVQVVASVALIWVMFTEGLNVDLGRLLTVRRRPLLLVRAFVAVNLLVPLGAWLLILWIEPQRRVAGALVLLAACPIAPLSLRRITRAGGEREAAVAIHLLLAMLAIASTPLTLRILGDALGFFAQAPLGSIARQIALTVVLPLLAGIAVAARWPGPAARLRRPGGRLAFLLLALVVLLAIAAEVRAFLDLDLADYLAMAAFVLMALAMGHLVGGEGKDRTILELECASRNIGLAFVIASLQPHVRSALPIVVPYLLIFVVISSSYLGLARALQGARSARGPPW